MRRIAAAVAVGAYCAFLLSILPASPFEWDEVLFLRAVESFDVAAHAPHPPGYPVYVAVARLATELTDSPILGCQLASVLGALLTVIGTGFLALELGAGRIGAWVAAVIVASVPAFAFNAPVGLSDVLATGCTTLAAWRLVAAARSGASGRDVLVAAVLCAVALAVRPQTASVLAPAAIWVHRELVKASRWLAILQGWTAAALASLACWLPAVILTGPARFFDAVTRQAGVLSEALDVRSLWSADLGWVLSRWLESPFGAGWLVAVWWMLVAGGVVAWWLTGRRVLVSVAVASAVSYLLVSASVMECIVAGRYVLPAIPWLAVLAAGATACPGPGKRCAGGIVVAALVAGWIAWWAPVIHRRAVEPAPLWAALTWLDEEASSGSIIVVDHLAIHHARWLVFPDGRTLVDRRRGEQASADPRGRVYRVIVRSLRPSDRTVFSSSWEDDRWRRLTRGRYLACRVEVIDP